MCLRAYADKEGPDQTTSVQSDQGLHCKLKESLHMFEDIFSLDAAHISDR